jgi:predicted enzyme related to lactoylglutathione lyase
MSNTIPLIVFPVTDLEKSKHFFSTFLGTEPYADAPYYVGYKLSDQEIGLDPSSTIGPIVYIDVTDIESSITEMTEAGAEVVQAAKDVGGGLLIAQVKDADGNIVGMRQQP